jgi:hypothetical protein
MKEKIVFMNYTTMEMILGQSDRSVVGDSSIVKVIK